MNPMEALREGAKKSIEKGLNSLGYEGKLIFQRAPEGKGVLALPCFLISKETGKNPAEVSKMLEESFDPTPLIKEAKAFGPYLNFFPDFPEFSRMVISEIMKDEDYGRAVEKGEKILLEHTSANPTGPLHVGRARNPIIGDTLARILRKYGNEVETEYYVDDMGKQAVMVAWGVERFGPAKEGERADYLYVKHYQRVNELIEKDEDVKREIEEWIRLYESGDEEIRKKVRRTVEQMMGGILKSLNRLGIDLDNLAYESDIVFSGKVDEVVNGLKEKGVLEEENGALYIDLGKYGVKGKDTRFFITRSDGTSLYSTRDVAYHIDKLNRADHLIDVLGEDHRLQSKAVGIMLEILGYEVPEVVFYAFVGLPEGRMSTRKGRVVYLDDLIEEAVERAYHEVKKRRSDLSEEEMKRIAEAVGTSAIRYNIIRVQPEKKMVFRWEDALNFEGESAPFIQYSYARASSIIRKAGEFSDEMVYEEEGEHKLILKMAEFPDVIRESAEKRRPHVVAQYLRDLASQFNEFYRDHRVIDAPEPLRSSRLNMVEAFRKVMREGMYALGLRVLERM